LKFLGSDNYEPVQINESHSHQILLNYGSFVEYVKKVNLWPYVNRTLLWISMAENRNCITTFEWKISILIFKKVVNM